RRGDRRGRDRWNRRLAAVPAHPASADPADHQHLFDPDIRRHLPGIRTGLCQPDGDGRPEFLHRPARHLPVPHLFRRAAAAGQPHHGRNARHGDLPDHPDGGRHLSRLHPVPFAQVSVLMKSNTMPGRAIASHLILMTWTVIALFPVALVIINSFKSRKAIFGKPLALPTPETFSLVGYEE